MKSNQPVSLDQFKHLELPNGSTLLLSDQEAENLQRLHLLVLARHRSMPWIIAAAMIPFVAIIFKLDQQPSILHTVLLMITGLGFLSVSTIPFFAENRFMREEDRLAEIHKDEWKTNAADEPEQRSVPPQFPNRLSKKQVVLCFTATMCAALFIIIVSLHHYL